MTDELLAEIQEAIEVAVVGEPRSPLLAQKAERAAQALVRRKGLRGVTIQAQTRQGGVVVVIHYRDDTRKVRSIRLQVC